MAKRYFEDCKIGDKRLTSGRTITETDIVLFAAFSGDWLPVHTNEEYARTSTFGERIAHGLLSLVVGNSLLVRVMEHDFLPEIIALCGIEKVRFVRPTRIGDTLYLETEIIRLIKAQNNTGIVTLKNRIRNQRQEDVISCYWKALVPCRPEKQVDSLR
jgi:3-hydroxybutyryl-CoA dehydratase